MSGGFVDPATLPTGPNGRPLCRWCALEVPPGRRRTFCSPYCVHEWRLRSDPGYLRDQVFARDRGICALCGLDTVAEYRRLRRLPRAKRPAFLAHRRSLWDADHILPVSRGGGECDLDNLRTLCLRCHREVTSKARDQLCEPAKGPASR
jgi:5-methylcytosine-specific restriction endonuclease McrA